MTNKSLWVVFCSIFFTHLCFSQPHIEDQSYIENERLRAEKLMAFNPNPNTQNYDIRYHKLELSINPNNYYISGTVTSRFIPVYNMNTIVFDLADELSVTQVLQGTQNLTYTHANDELVITLAQTVNANSLGEVKIMYAGEPPSENSAFTQSSHNGTPIIWTLSEPFGSKDWWPCKEDLQDKIENIEVLITAPNTYTSVSNGIEISQINNANGTKTTHFAHNYPIPAYLVAIAVTNYQVYNQNAGSEPNTFPIVNYLYPESYNNVLPQLNQTLAIMNLFESLFETYPFHEEKYGHAQFGWGGGMEHTTVSFMGNFSRSLIAHELAHQWFGNKITCGTWQDIWLNEGFAEYLSGLVVENFDGNNAFNNWKANKIQSVTSLPDGNVYLTPTQAENSNRIFSSRLTYNKGSMVVHMLRDKLGDEEFFQGVKNYLQDPQLAYAHALTPQLQAHLEETSGENLTEFFNDWVYGQGHPIISMNYSNVINGQIVITLSQTPSHNTTPFFELPLKVKVVANNGQEEMFTLNFTENNQTFFVDTILPNVNSITINPNKDVICTTGTIFLSNDKFDLQNKIKIYPNPSKNSITIDMPEKYNFDGLTIYDINGKKIMESMNKNISIAHLASGNYIIEIKSDKEIFHKKILKN